MTESRVALKGVKRYFAPQGTLVRVAGRAFWVGTTEGEGLLLQSTG